MSLTPNGSTHSISDDLAAQQSPTPNVATRFAANVAAPEWFAEAGLVRRRLVHPTQSLYRQPEPTLSGLLEAFKKICQRWRLTKEEQLTLLGYAGAEAFLTELQRGQSSFVPQDTKDRIGYVLAISIGLGAIFGESESAELDWLKNAHRHFSPLSPLSYALQGKMHHLIAVADQVKREQSP